MPTMTNEQRSAAEVAAFRAEQPERYFAYRGHGTRFGELQRDMLITTWTGDKLATVFAVGPVWRSNMDDRRQSFRARAITGDVYSGIAYLDSGDYVRMRKVRS